MRHAPHAPDEFDLDYTIEDDIPPDPKRDSQFIFDRAPNFVADKATEGPPGRVLDVGCAFGEQLDLLRTRKWESWGLDASFELSRYCHRRFPNDPPRVVCATAEQMPFRDGGLDRIVCQGSLDHFAQPEAFLQEAARVLRPNGRLVIAISNFDSLSCRLGRATYTLRRRLGRPVLGGRHYWAIPRNHTWRGTTAALRCFAEPHLELVECRGASMLWLFPRWTQLVEALPERWAWRTMRALDRVAYRVPAIADMLITVRRPRRRSDGLR